MKQVFGIRLEPYTLEEARKIAKTNSDNSVEAIVSVDIDQLIGGDRENFLDFLSDSLCSEICFEDIDYVVVGHCNNDLFLKVNAMVPDDQMEDE
jgi:hypothetical protein